MMPVDSLCLTRETCPPHSHIVSDTNPLKRSPLHESHLGLNARMVPFAGWEMPVQYNGIVEEHKAVRNAVGVFDISHMGQFLVEGADAEKFLNYALTNNCSRLADSEGQYTLMLNEVGGVIDDLIVYRLTADSFFLVVNASMIAEDRVHLESLMSGYAVVLTNLSDRLGGLAIQGPKSEAVWQRVVEGQLPYPARNTIATLSTEAGTIYACGTGYTGEKGFEFFSPDTEISDWFAKFVTAAREEGGLPCGLGSRDTLRLEMGYPLNGNDLAQDKTPLQAGLGFFVDLTKDAFVGRDVLIAQKEAGLPSKLTAFRVTGTAPPPRPHYTILHNDVPVGEINSGALSPSIGQGIGMAYLPVSLSKPGIPLEIEIRGKKYAAETVKKPFYHPPTP